MASLVERLKKLEDNAKENDITQINFPIDATSKSILREHIWSLNASTVDKGVVRLTTPPVNQILPLAVGNNDTVLPVYEADAGSNDTYVITADPALTAYTTGQIISFKANTANTGTATLNINNLGAKAIKKLHDQDLADNDIEANQIVTVIYDGTNFQMQSQIANLATPTVPATDLQEFTGSGTYTKPVGAVSVKVQAWGGGGGGGSVTVTTGSNTGAGGGGGGVYIEFTFDAGDVGATEDITIPSAAVAGAAGGDSTFGSLLTAFGGGAGVDAPNDQNSGGGGGGGNISAGADSTAANPNGTGGAGGSPFGGIPSTDGEKRSSFGGGAGGSDGTSNEGEKDAGLSSYGGGGGGGGKQNTGAGDGGKSVWGGGGGSGGGVGAAGTAGTSQFGGDGGVGGDDANGTNGATPAGGGGGAGKDTNGTNTGGTGGAGQIIVTTYV